MVHQRTCCVERRFSPIGPMRKEMQYSKPGLDCLRLSVPLREPTHVPAVRLWSRLAFVVSGLVRDRVCFSQCDGDVAQDAANRARHGCTELYDRIFAEGDLQFSNSCRNVPCPVWDRKPHLQVPFESGGVFLWKELIGDTDIPSGCYRSSAAAPEIPCWKDGFDRNPIARHGYGHCGARFHCDRQGVGVESRHEAAVTSMTSSVRNCDMSCVSYQ